MDNRIKLLRNKLNMSQGIFGKRLGVTGAGISKIENGKRNLTEQMLLMVCKEFSVNEHWLRFGEGEIFKQKHPYDIEQLAQSYQLDELDKRIIYEYARLDDSRRKVIKEYIMRIASISSKDNMASEYDTSAEVLKCAEEPANEYNS